MSASPCLCLLWACGLSCSSWLGSFLSGRPVTVPVEVWRAATTGNRSLSIHGRHLLLLLLPSFATTQGQCKSTRQQVAPPLESKRLKPANRLGELRSRTRKNALSSAMLPRWSTWFECPKHTRTRTPPRRAVLLVLLEFCLGSETGTGWLAVISR